MGEKKTKKTDSPKSVKKNSRRTLLRFAICGVILSVIGGALLCLCNDNGDKEDDTQKTTVAINTKEDAEKYLCENSNYSAGECKRIDIVGTTSKLDNNVCSRLVKESVFPFDIASFGLNNNPIKIKSNDKNKTKTQHEDTPVVTTTIKDKNDNQINIDDIDR